MIRKNGKTYYPLTFGKMIFGGKVYYDRSARQQNYFYLDLLDTRVSQNSLIPRLATGLITADGKRFRINEP